jgi:DNA-binding XRE family transcriptional regulator
VSPRREHRALLTPRMIKAARALCGLDQSHLAVLAGVSKKTIAVVESARPSRVDARRRAVLEKIRQRLETEFDLEFIFADESTGAGLRVRKRGRC